MWAKDEVKWEIQEGTKLRVNDKIILNYSKQIVNREIKSNNYISSK